MSLCRFRPSTSSREDGSPRHKVSRRDAGPSLLVIGDVGEEIAARRFYLCVERCHGVHSRSCAGPVEL